ncbi:stress-activated map kinase-interacting protein 1, variant 2 [Coprinopsis cinerea AmutBmut pab1-1]|nr:stress-activated map kinase-interacting protein 1, variant 2 [Coprinopsis cinerea AmutBmut pab1-1]
MSLISDTDYLIHQIRLSYLRDSEDLYGPRIISLDPSYQGNPYIVASGLADLERWRELATPHSPDLSEEENENASGFPGARLKYTQTIMGGKSGGLGMRVHGKRMSTSKRLSQIQPAPKDAQPEVKNFVTSGALVQTQDTLSTSAPPASTSTKSAIANVTAEPWAMVDAPPDGDKTEGSPGPNVHIQVPTAPEEAPVQKVVQFVPRFSAETEARRRMRIAARRGPNAIPQAPPPPLSFDTTSEEEVDNNDDSDVSSEGFGVDHSDDESMDDGDEFDPDFAATNITSDSASEVISIMSGMSSMPNSSAPDSTHAPYRSRTARLSPVTETRRGHSRPRPANLTLEGTTLVNGPKSEGDASMHKKSNSNISRSKSDNSQTILHGPSSSISSSMELMFTRKKVVPAKPGKSALSAMLADSSGSSNPFAELYAAMSGRAEGASVNVQVYFPHATNPAGKPMDLNVRKDATVEEVIGYALWNYWEEGWLPKLDEGLDPEDPKREQVLSAVGWILRIAEDDGEVDDDFPPPDRMGKIVKFNSDAYAILAATPAQIQQNEILESKIQRRPSRTLNTKKSDKLTVPQLSAVPSGSGSPFMGSDLGSVPLSTSLGPSFTHGPQIFLRIRVTDTPDTVHISTTIPVSAGMYMQEALEMVCRRRKLQNPKDYALLLELPDGKTTIMVPLDRTVASLQGNRELRLVKRNMLHTLGLNISKEIKTTDPNASIFKGVTDTPEQQHSSALDWTAAYKKYTIYRKMPMLVTRQERTLAIDGVYIHVRFPPPVFRFVQSGLGLYDPLVSVARRRRGA